MFIVEFSRPPENRAGHCDFAHVLGHMGEVVSAGDIPHRIDVPLRSSAPIVDDDASVSHLNSGVGQLQIIDHRPAADRSKCGVAGECGSVVKLCKEAIVISTKFRSLRTDATITSHSVEDVTLGLRGADTRVCWVETRLDPFGRCAMLPIYSCASP